MANLTIATVHYDHIPLEHSADGKGMTLGQQIDRHITDAVREGKMVQEVAVHFEGPDEQRRLMDAYRARPGSIVSTASKRA